MAWPSVYTYNFCSNPSFEQNLTGVSAINGASILQDPSMWLYGTQSLRVTCPGQNPNEGVILPPGTVLASSTGAVSFSLQANTPTASGTLNVFAIDLTSSTTLGSTTVTFDNTTSWQLVQITGLALVNAHSIAVYVETVGIQQTAFNIDAVQYEPSLTLNAGVLPTPYIDGDQPFGTWVGTAEESASFKPFQLMMGASGTVITSGNASLLARGASIPLVFTDPASGPAVISGNVDLSGKSFIGLNNAIRSGGGTVSVTAFTIVMMFAGLNDFALWQPGDTDPAESLVGWNNAGVSSGVNTSGNAGWTRPFATFSAPQAFTGSTTTNVWNSAAYFAVGYQLGSVANAGAQNVSHVQAELVPGNGGVVTPTTYIRPRALTATLAPTFMNFVTNPSFETNTTGWVAIGGTIAQSTAHAQSGTHSLFMSGTGIHIGAYTVVPDLIIGETYTVSGYTFTTDGSQRLVTVAVNPTSGFGSSASATVTAGTTAFTQVSVQFTATASTEIIAFWSMNAGGTSVAQNVYLDAVMLNPGGLEAYGDGNLAGWSWETGGTANNTRSYFYERGNVAYAAVQSILAGQLPLGLHAYAPVYNAPVTQYS